MMFVCLHTADESDMPNHKITLGLISLVQFHAWIISE